MRFETLYCTLNRYFTGDYLQNRCPPSNPSCKPCGERHFDCSNLGDGLHAVSKDTPTSDYAICFRGRTIATESCPDGLFDSAQRRCVGSVTEGTQQ